MSKKKPSSKYYPPAPPLPPRHIEDYLNNCSIQSMDDHVSVIKFLDYKLLDEIIDNADEQDGEFLNNDELLTGIHIRSDFKGDKSRDEEFYFLIDESAEAAEEGRRILQATSVKYNRDNTFSRWESVFPDGNHVIHNNYLVDDVSIRFVCNEDEEKEYVWVKSGPNPDDKSSMRLERKLRYLRIGDVLKENAKTAFAFCADKIFGLKGNAMEILGFETRTKSECSLDRIRLLSKRYTPIDE